MTVVKMRMSSLLVLLLVLLSCLADKQYVAFDDYTVCSVTQTVGNDTEIVVTGEREGTSGSNSFTSCEIQFRAGKAGQGLCVKIDELTFSNNKLQLKYFDNFDVHGSQPFKTFQKSDEVYYPKEYCSNHREIALQLTRFNDTTTPSIRDVTIDIKVNNMQGNTRIGAMDKDCGVTYDMMGSHVSVLNRQSTSTDMPPSLCQLTFKYTGSNPNHTVCLQYNRLKTDCGYELMVHDGNPSDFVPTGVTYSCENAEPSQWCSSRGEFYIVLERPTPNAAEMGSIFSMSVKDGIKGDVVFPAPEVNSGWWSSLSTGAQAGIGLAIAGGVLVIILSVFCYFKGKKSKGVAL